MAITPITDVLREYLGSDSLDPARLVTLSPCDLDVKEFYRLIRKWSEVFEFPLIGVGELRPWHTRPFDYHIGKIEGEPLMTPRWDTPPLYRWPWVNTSQETAFIDAIKLHCLYFEGVVVEMPLGSGHLDVDKFPPGEFHIKAILNFIVSCAHMAPLIDADTVVVTPPTPLLLPDHSEVLRGMQKESREIMPTFGASISLQWIGYDLWIMANDFGGPEDRGNKLLASFYPILQDLRLSTLFPDVDPALDQKQLNLLRRIRDKVTDTTPFDHGVGKLVLCGRVRRRVCECLI